jgi:hypothetical protein
LNLTNTVEPLPSRRQCGVTVLNVPLSAYISSFHAETVSVHQATVFMDRVTTDDSFAAFSPTQGTHTDHEFEPKRAWATLLAL